MPLLLHVDVLVLLIVRHILLACSSGVRCWSASFDCPVASASHRCFTSPSHTPLSRCCELVGAPSTAIDLQRRYSLLVFGVHIRGGHALCS